MKLDGGAENLPSLSIDYAKIMDHAQGLCRGGLRLEQFLDTLQVGQR
jgi:hypothetical protein